MLKIQTLTDFKLKKNPENFSVIEKFHRFCGFFNIMGTAGLCMCWTCCDSNHASVWLQQSRDKTCYLE